MVADFSFVQDRTVSKSVQLYINECIDEDWGKLLLGDEMRLRRGVKTKRKADADEVRRQFNILRETDVKLSQTILVYQPGLRDLSNLSLVYIETAHSRRFTFPIPATSSHTDSSTDQTLSPGRNSTFGMNPSRLVSKTLGAPVVRVLARTWTEEHSY